MSPVEYFPPTRNFGRTLIYGVATAFAGIIITTVVLSPSTILGTVAITLILIGLAIFVPVNFRALKKYGYDTRGVYQWGKSIFQWQQVKRISLDFKKSSGSFPIYAKPTWVTLAGGIPIIEHPEWVSYGASMVFILEDGRSFAIKSSLDNLTKKGVIESVDELAKTANPRIEFE
jgi:hypothetical protein